MNEIEFRKKKAAAFIIIHQLLKEKIPRQRRLWITKLFQNKLNNDSSSLLSILKFDESTGQYKNCIKSSKLSAAQHNYRQPVGSFWAVAEDFLYGSVARGGCGIRLLAKDSDIAAVDSGFKLITPSDDRLASDAAAHAEETAGRRLRKNANVAEVGHYFSGKEDCVFYESHGYGDVANVWSRARNASKRLGVSWTVDGSHNAITRVGAILRRKQRREVMRTIRESLRLKRTEALATKPDQDSSMECVAADSASTHFINAGDFTRFMNWRFIHRAWLNLMPLNGFSSWRAGDRRFRQCGYITENLSHIVDHCTRYTAFYLVKHNAIVARIKKAARTQYQVITEKQAIGVRV
ncbi:Hypothetical protein CINCED_3A004846 [Cinara cedri]|uniref:Uncharacterized protein n=1 Tax=Cinara cedri TaxID=506608 RepID=A0A5E4MBW3_9HEMI|nr:Hypothetical protein CINCED_3A004846 [Cinara cedri]